VLAGLCRAIAAELPCRLIDLPPSPRPLAAGEARRLAERLAAELLAPRTAGVIALRQGKRWVETWETVAGVPSGDPTLRPDRSYLVVGDLGSPMAAELLAALASLPARVARVGSGERGEVAAVAEPACELEPEWLAGRAAELAAALESAESTGAEALDALCGRYALAALAAAGVEAVPGREIAEDELRRQIALAPAQERLLERLLSMLAEDGAIAREDGIVRFLLAPSPAGPPELRQEIEARSPELAGLCRLLDRAAAALPRVLSGELEGLAVLYPEGSASLFAEVPGDPPADPPGDPLAAGAGEVPGDSPEKGSAAGARRFAAAGDLPSALLVEALVQAAAAARRAGRPFRVLEAGAGQGLLTRHLLPALETAAGSALQYVFTDLGRSFVLAAERDALETGRRGCRFGILDASRDPLAQGYSPGSFDAVVAANVVHATPRVVETLRHLRSLLAPGGVLGLVETVRQHRWNDLVWGLTDGWWSFADPELRTGSPLLTPAAWRGALAAAGFEAAGAFPAAGTAAGAALLLARQPAAAAAAGPDALLIPADIPADLADAGALAGAVAEARRRLGALDGAFYLAPASSGGVDRFAAALPSALAGARAVAAALTGFPPRFLALCAEPGAATALAALAVERLTMPVLALAWGPAAPGLTRLQAALAAALAGGAPAVALAPPAVAAGPLQEPGEPAPATSPGEESDVAAAGFHDRPRLVNPYVAPRDEVEQAVAAIWRRALGIDRIGVDDNFLELGGDSLTGLQVAHAVQERWNLAGRAFSLYETPTVSAIARRIAAVSGTSGASGASGEATDHDAEAVPEDRGASRGERRRARRAPARRTEA
jgi:phthiocerol/phenolphthiocerol synthesis type-I polyketide synthase E